MKKKYLITTKTSNDKNAGTDAKVFIQLFGAKPDVFSDEIRLDNKENNFEKGKTDEFEIEAKDIGWLKEIRIFHNNKGDKPAWKLNSIAIKDLKADYEWNIYVNKWFSQDEDDKLTDRTIEVPFSSTIISSKLTSCYIGWSRIDVDNDSDKKRSYRPEIGFEFESGCTVFTEHSQKTSTIDASVKVRVDWDLLGGGVNFFSKKVTDQLVERNETTQKKISKFQASIDLDAEAKTSITALLIWQQTVQTGIIEANNISVDFEDAQMIALPPSLKYFEKPSGSITTDEECLNFISNYLREYYIEPNVLNSLPGNNQLTRIPLEGKKQKDQDANSITSIKDFEQKTRKKSIKVLKKFNGIRIG